MASPRNIASVAGLLLTLTFAVPGRALAADPVGTWQTADGRARIRTEHCGPDGTRLCGYLVWMLHPYDREGGPMLDMENPVPAMRTRPVLGEEIMSGLKPGDGGRYSGEVYDFGDGRSSDVVLWSDGASRLSVIGCAPRVFCGTQTWTRAAGPMPSQLVGLTGAADGPRADE